MKEKRKLKRELKTLVREMEVLNDFPKRVENLLEDLGEFGGCNMYVNYTELKLNVRNAADRLYKTLRGQMALTLQNRQKDYLEICRQSALGEINSLTKKVQ